MKKAYMLPARAGACGVLLTAIEAVGLLKAEKKLRKWHELECGTENYCISRDDDNDRPFYEFASGHRSKYIKDIEAEVLNDIAEWCKMRGYYYFQQGDPRGCALYIGTQPMTQANYNAIGVGIY